MSHLMKGFVPAAVLGLVLGAAGQAKADLQFSTTEAVGTGTANGAVIHEVAVIESSSGITTSATVDNAPVFIFPGIEGGFFTISPTVNYGTGGVNSASRDLLDLANGPLSDRLRATASPTGTFITVNAGSDNILGLFPSPGNQNFGTIIENGTLQYLFTARLRTSAGVVLTCYNFRMQSDPPTPSAVPEPGAIALALSGLPVLGMLWARRRRVGA